MHTESSFDIEEIDSEGETTSSRQIRPAILWLGVLGLLILFIPLYLMAGSLQNELNRLEMLAVATSVDPLQSGSIPVTLTAVHQQIGQMATLFPTLDAANVDWQAAMAAVTEIDSSAIQIIGLEQAGTQLLIHGRAVNDDLVAEYALQLEASGQFSQVVIESLVQVPEPFQTPIPTVPQPTPVPTAVPTNTPRPTAVPTLVPVTPKPTWTPTPKLTDDFEWDDNVPKPIFVGAPAQPHNFYPEFDVDKLVFLAKAGRTYEVRTDFLAPGVDTYLSVTIGETTLTNDDARLGVLSSSVTVQAPPETDVEVLVVVSNRGVYGPEQWYDIEVVEIVPTTPTPSVTATNAPPTMTPSPTQDLRDQHEPNDVDPNPIAIEEAQFHNFYPAGDLDKVGMLVKNGRFYQVVTSDLGIGVDTALTVAFNGEIYSNDDYDLPGSGNFASAVCFPAESDGTAVATITNVGQQFGPDKTYVVSVQEIPSLTTGPDAVAFDATTEGDSNPAPQLVQIEGSEPIDWFVTTETPWIGTDVITGTTPSTLSLTANIASLAPGLHEGEITIGWAEFCRQVIPVTIQIEPVESRLPAENGRFLAMFNLNRRQITTVEFVIAVTLKPVEP